MGRHPPHCLIEVPVIEGVIHPLLERIKLAIVSDEAHLRERVTRSGQFQNHDVVVSVHPGTLMPCGQPVEHMTRREVELLGDGQHDRPSLTQPA